MPLRVLLVLALAGCAREASLVCLRAAQPAHVAAWVCLVALWNAKNIVYHVEHRNASTLFLGLAVAFYISHTLAGCAAAVLR